MASLGERIAQTGKDVRAAMDRSRKAEAAQQKAQAVEDYATKLETIDPLAAASVRAGRNDISALVSLRKEQAGGSDKFKKTFDQFSVATSMTNAIQEKLSAAAEEVQKAYESGDEAAINQAKQNYSAQYDVYGEKLKNYVSSLDNNLKASRAIDLMQNAEQNILSKMKPEKIELMEQTMINKIKSSSALDPKLQHDLDNMKELYGVDVDLKGIPSSESIYKLALAGVHNGAITQKTMDLIMNTKDTKQLLDVANAEDTPQDIKILAGAIAKQQLAVDTFMPDIKAQYAKKPTEDLLNAAFQEGSVVGQRISAAAQTELEKRGAFGETPTPLTSGGFLGAIKVDKKKEVKDAYKTLQKFETLSKKGSVPKKLQAEAEKARTLLEVRGLIPAEKVANKPWQRF